MYSLCEISVSCLFCCEKAGPQLEMYTGFESASDEGRAKFPQHNKELAGKRKGIRVVEVG